MTRVVRAVCCFALAILYSPYYAETAIGLRRSHNAFGASARSEMTISTLPVTPFVSHLKIRGEVLVPDEISNVDMYSGRQPRLVNNQWLTSVLFFYQHEALHKAPNP